MFLGGFFSLLILVGVILVVVWLVGGDGLPNRPTGSGDRSETPLEILKKRYARGEITRDQFEQMKRDLKDDGRGQA